MKYLILIFAATILAVNSASASPKSFELTFKELGKNKIALKNGDNDNPFPPNPEPLLPFRMGTWKVLVTKFTSTFDGENWQFSQENVCHSQAQAGVFNLVGKDNFYMEAPSTSIVRCALTYKGETFAVDFTPYVLFGQAVDPFTGNERMVKYYTFWQWPVWDDNSTPPEDFLNQLLVSKNMGTTDLELRNSLFMGANMGVEICRGGDQQEPLPGPLTDDDDDNCEPPEPGTTIEAFLYTVEMNDPEGGL